MFKHRIFILFQVKEVQMTVKMMKTRMSMVLCLLRWSKNLILIFIYKYVHSDLLTENLCPKNFIATCKNERNKKDRETFTRCDYAQNMTTHEVECKQEVKSTVGLYRSYFKVRVLFASFVIIMTVCYRKMYPDLKEQLTEYKQHLLDSTNEIPELKAWQMQGKINHFIACSVFKVDIFSFYIARLKKALTSLIPVLLFIAQITLELRARLFKESNIARKITNWILRWNAMGTSL